MTKDKTFSNLCQVKNKPLVEKSLFFQHSNTGSSSVVSLGVGLSVFDQLKTGEYLGNLFESFYFYF